MSPPALHLPQIRLPKPLAVVVVLVVCLAAVLVDAADLVVSGETIQNKPFGTSESWDLITGTGNLLETGMGEIRLTGSGLSGFSGGITVNGGALVVSAPGQLGAASNTVSVIGGATTGYGGGMLVVDGGASGITLAQDISVSGRGPIPFGTDVGILSIGNNTFSGPMQLGSSTSAYFGVAYGNTTLNGPVNLGTTSNYILGTGNLIIAGSLSSSSASTLTRTYSNIGGGLWLQNINNSFTGSVTTNLSTVRVSDGRALGKGTQPISFSTTSGTFEVRADAATASTFGATKIGASSNTGNLFLDRAVGGTGLFQIITFGSLDFSNAASATNPLNIYSRDGYGISIGAVNGTLVPRSFRQPQHTLASLWDACLWGWKVPVVSLRSTAG